MHAIAGGAAARPFVTHHNALGMDLFMRIALEIPLKKLMVGGIQKVYEIGRVFRNEGVDTQHNPEFTLLELYHAYGDLSTVMELTESLTAHLAKELTGGTKVSYGEATLDLTPPWPRYDYMDLLRQYTQVDPGDAGALQQKLRERGQDPAGRSKIDLMDEVFSRYVEPHLQSAAFVTGQPIEMTPLCREYQDRPGFADRFEAYVAGMEIANAYNELNDPQIQRRRLLDQAGGDQMAKQGKLDEDFLLALEHGMPPAGGLGIGIDRLVMLLTNQPSIREVILFPLLKEEPKESPSSDVK
jgi:lysyl-tRNA synthetase class 2